jgi:hypothetical protein
MTVVDTKAIFERVERNPFLTAAVLSLVIHLALFGTWQMGKQLGWWKHHPTWLTNLTRKLASAPVNARQKQPAQPPVIPMTFIEVDPDTAVAEAPKEAKYYSSKNAKAANPDPKNEQQVKVDGQQEQVPRTMDNEKPKAFPLQPAPPKPKPEVIEEPKPRNDAPGNLAFVKPSPKPPSDGQIDTTTGESETPKERPRTLAQARAQKGILTGEKMKQPGGVSSRGSVAFDVKATPFGEYDRAFIDAVEKRWYELIDNHRGTHRAGKVVVEFLLTYDGRIEDMRVSDDGEVGVILSTLCQNAILDPAPYPRWPAQMRQTIGGNTREIRFTFYYN